MVGDRASLPDRRRFLVAAGGALATGGIVSASVRPKEHVVSTQSRNEPPVADSGVAAPGDATPGDATPSAVAVEVTVGTIAEAEKLAAVTYTPEERAVLVTTIGTEIERIRSRRGFELPNDLAPALVFDPGGTAPRRHAAVRATPRPPSRPLPARDEDIAFAPVTDLSAWIAAGALTSERLTELYLARLERRGPRLECVVTLTKDLARAQARAADAEIAAGRWRGPLHGIPWGAKDLLDTAGIPTTWGAAPYRDRIPTGDAVVVERLAQAGAVLVAKLTLGAIAYGDIWYGGLTRNPWKIDQGSSGSSAGSAAATAAGLVGFSLGTETLGSIVSPCMRCGATGLRPTFSRVARTGAMALCWSLDKIGPICRTVQDTMHVLGAINGADSGDASSRDEPFSFDPDRGTAGLRLGYHPSWFEGESASDLDRAALEAARRAGFELVTVELPDWPYETLMTVLLTEAAAAFEELTLSNRDDELAWQDPEAWPNTFRQARFIPAIEYVQADRFRRRVATMMAERFEAVDALIAPSYAASLLLITNCTGHPSLTLRTGIRDDGTPRGITLCGRLFDESTLGTIGIALERELGVWDLRPKE